MSNSCAVLKVDVVELAKPLAMDFCIQCQIMVASTQNWSRIEFNLPIGWSSGKSVYFWLGAGTGRARY